MFNLFIGIQVREVNKYHMTVLNQKKKHPLKPVIRTNPYLNVMSLMHIMDLFFFFLTFYTIII